MAKINLLYVITKLELGGAQKQLLSLITHLDKERYNIFLFTAREGLLLEDAAGIPGLALKRSRFLERSINPLEDLLSLFELYHYIKNNRIAIVHTHSSKAGIVGRLAARCAGVRVIIHTVHGWPFHEYQPRLKRFFFILLERLAARLTDVLVTVNDSDKGKGLRNAIGDTRRYRVIRCGIDYSEFYVKDTLAKSEFGLAHDEVAVGTIACLKPQKSPLDFIRLAASTEKEFPGIKFILVGDGALRKEIEHSIGRNHLEGKVILTGWRRDISRLLSVFDVFVLTSLWEGLPVTVLEAMAAAKPVIATDTGGIAEVLIEGKTGFLASRGDVGELREKLIVLLKDPALGKRVGQAARESLGRDYTREKMVQDSDELYLKMCIAKKVAYAG